MNKLREAVLRRDGKCFKCGRIDRLHMHHLKPRKKGGKDELNNLIALCGKCHLKADLSLKAYGKTRYYKDMEKAVK